jgi:hypothetical protein
MTSMVVAAAVLSALVFSHVTLLECTTMNTMSKTISNATQMIGLQAPLPSEEDRDPRPRTRYSEPPSPVFIDPLG